MISSDPVGTRDGHADADIRINIRIYRAISDICRIMQISALMRIGKYIRIAIPSGYTVCASCNICGPPMHEASQCKEFPVSVKPKK